MATSTNENITTHHTREREKKENQKFHAEQNSFKLHEKMNNKIVLALAIVVVGVIVDCGSSETQYEDAGTIVSQFHHVYFGISQNFTHCISLVYSLE